MVTLRRTRSRNARKIERRAARLSQKKRGKNLLHTASSTNHREKEEVTLSIHKKKAPRLGPPRDRFLDVGTTSSKSITLKGRGKKGGMVGKECRTGKKLPGVPPLDGRWTTGTEKCGPRTSRPSKEKRTPGPETAEMPILGKTMAPHSVGGAGQALGKKTRGLIRSIKV